MSKINKNFSETTQLILMPLQKLFQDKRFATALHTMAGK